MSPSSLTKKATEYAVLIWDSPEDQEAWDEDGCLGSPCREYNVDILEQAMEVYEQVTNVFAKELHHYYEYKTHEWESASNVLVSYYAHKTHSDKAIEVMECVQQNINGQAFVNWLHKELGLGEEE